MLAKAPSQTRNHVGYVLLLPFGLVALSRARKHLAPKPPETIGDHVRKRRTTLGLSQAGAAHAIGVCRDALAGWEIRPVQPKGWLTLTIIALLGYDPQPAASSFAERLRRARRATGPNEMLFDALIDVPEHTLHAWEQGLYEPGCRRFAVVIERLQQLDC